MEVVVGRIQEAQDEAGVTEQSLLNFVYVHRVLGGMSLAVAIKVTTSHVAILQDIGRLLGMVAASPHACITKASGTCFFGFTFAAGGFDFQFLIHSTMLSLDCSHALCAGPGEPRRHTCVTVSGGRRQV
jgi:hypothetical protein